ncbi:hypothetical protein LCGC14_0294760 [marine sediment metagenome]|uniref:DUF1330 domain-containing protein n=1 Tax=marine sediment metagenome TaxID=412755 RepID=A0A0F9WXU5_9ZZZZ
MGWVEARLVIPTHPDQYSPFKGKGQLQYITEKEYQAQLRALEVNLVKAFGGFTVTEGRGAWDSGTHVEFESVRVYTIAIDSTKADFHPYLLRQEVARRLGQRAVYLSVTKLEGQPIQ